MFFTDGGIAPASGAIKLCDQRLCVLHADLVDAVLVAIQRQQVSVRPVARGVNGI